MRIPQKTNLPSQFICSNTLKLQNPCFTEETIFANRLISLDCAYSLPPSQYHYTLPPKRVFNVCGSFYLCIYLTPQSRRLRLLAAQTATAIACSTSNIRTNAITAGQRPIYIHSLHLLHQIHHKPSDPGSDIPAETYTITGSSLNLRYYSILLLKTIRCLYEY